MTQGPVVSRALIRLCELLERPQQQRHPDAVWLRGQQAVFAYLRECQAVSLSTQLASQVLCPACQRHHLQPQCERTEQGPRYRGQCHECHWVDLAEERVHCWQADPQRVAQWLHSALQLTRRHELRDCRSGQLWYLGQRTHRRQRRDLFFGCRLDDDADQKANAIAALATPAATVILTTTDPSRVTDPVLRGTCLIPLPAVAKLRKGRLLIEGLDSYFDRPIAAASSDETSLRLLRSDHVALIQGERHRVGGQPLRFLLALLKADGDELTRRRLADVVGLRDDFSYADIRKRHKAVFSTFVEHAKGEFWIKPEYRLPDSEPH